MIFGLNKTWTLLYPDPSVFPGLTKLISESLPFVNLFFSARLPACISWWKVFRKWFVLYLMFLERLFIIIHISCKWNEANPKTKKTLYTKVLKKSFRKRNIILPFQVTKIVFARVFCETASGERRGVGRIFTSVSNLFSNWIFFFNSTFYIISFYSFSQTKSICNNFDPICP